MGGAEFPSAGHLFELVDVTWLEVCSVAAVPQPMTPLPSLHRRVGQDLGHHRRLDLGQRLLRILPAPALRRDLIRPRMPTPRWPQYGAELGRLRRGERHRPVDDHQVAAAVPAGDRHGPHKKAEVVDWCSVNGVQLVLTPSNASWLNWIECEFAALRYFTLDGSDYPSHNAQENAIAGYVRWHNKHAQPKRHFAIDSKIRRPAYLPDVA
jgi:hypothetical protein